MLVDVTTEIIINRTIDIVSDFASNPDNITKWYKNIKTVDWKTDRPCRMGSRIAFVAHFLGSKISYTYEIVELNLPQKLVMKTSEGPFPMETTYVWQQVESGKTRMTLRNQGKPVGFSWLVSPFMVLAMKSANRKDLLNLKRVLES